MDVPTWATTFDFHWKRMESWVGMKTLVFCSGYDDPTLFRNLQMRSLACRKRGTLQAFRIITRQPPPNQQRSPLSTHWGHNEQFCGFEPWEFSPIPSSLKEVYIYMMHKRKWLTFYSDIVMVINHFASTNSLIQDNCLLHNNLWAMLINMT